MSLPPVASLPFRLPEKPPYPIFPSEAHAQNSPGLCSPVPATTGHSKRRRSEERVYLVRRKKEYVWLIRGRGWHRQREQFSYTSLFFWVYTESEEVSFLVDDIGLGMK